MSQGGAAPPGEIRAASASWIASAVAGVVAGVLALAAVEAFLDEFGNQVVAKDEVATTDAIRETALNSARLAILLAVVALVLVVFLWRGRRWARTGLTVVAGLDVLIAVLGLVVPTTLEVYPQLVDLGSTSARVLYVLAALLAVAAVVASSRPAATRFVTATPTRA